VPLERVEALRYNGDMVNELLLATIPIEVDKLDIPACAAKTPDESVLKDESVIFEKNPNEVDNDDTETCKIDILNEVDDMDDKRFVFCVDKLDPMTVEKVERPV
jgi:hypothetical protein